jgi:hypothetical protein
MALAAVWNSAAAEQSSAEYVAGVGATVGGGGGGGGGAALSLVHPARTRHPTAIATTRRTRVFFRKAGPVSVIPTVPGMAPPSALVDALVDVSDGAMGMVYVDHGLDLTRNR